MKNEKKRTPEERSSGLQKGKADREKRVHNPESVGPGHASHEPVGPLQTCADKEAEIKKRNLDAEAEAQKVLRSSKPVGPLQTCADIKKK